MVGVWRPGDGSDHGLPTLVGKSTAARRIGRGKVATARRIGAAKSAPARRGVIPKAGRRRRGFAAELRIRRPSPNSGGVGSVEPVGRINRRITAGDAVGGIGAPRARRRCVRGVERHHLGAAGRGIAEGHGSERLASPALRRSGGRWAAGRGRVGGPGRQPAVRGPGGHHVRRVEPGHGRDALGPGLGAPGGAGRQGAERDDPAAPGLIQPGWVCVRSRRRPWGRGASGGVGRVAPRTIAAPALNDHRPHLPAFASCHRDLDRPAQKIRRQSPQGGLNTDNPGIDRGHMRRFTSE